ncbi:MAG: Lrp/AsnC ligand binding domain-containing protein [Dactylosporangium sp.]|nr:Lrp/AsnC ligand binding domain-containing protein [Dactylosporangium sp.]NNJ60618.1 Lrp/AsnC ligand binding domain-containing protein [Dactylosporangium sp.]
MVQAYILIQTKVGKAREVAVEIRAITGVVRVDAVTGPYDVVALAEARTINDLGQMIVGSVQRVPAITRTLTCSVASL